MVVVAAAADGAVVSSCCFVSGTRGLSLTGLELWLAFGLECGMVSGEGCSEPMATSGSLPALESA